MTVEGVFQKDCRSTDSWRITMKFTFPPNSRPLDGYTLKRGIARGGFGEVYFALSDAGKEVAVKLLQHNLDVELRGVMHCLNLRHPHLIAIHDVKTDSDGDHWVVMEYIGGKTLENILADQNGPLPMAEIDLWMKGIESGLAYLHDRGIVHRDVKPGNLFWDQGAIKIGDVGLSKFMTPSRRSAHTESVGTVYYMAPEVTYGKYGYEVDIYSTGVILYEMLTGKLPFDGQSTGEILMKHLSEPPDLSVVPAAFQGVLARALEKDPTRRTPTIGRMLEDYERARQGDSTLAPGAAKAVSPAVSNGAIPLPPPLAVPPNLPNPQGFGKGNHTSAKPVSANQRIGQTSTRGVDDDSPRLEWWLARLGWFGLIWITLFVYFSKNSLGSEFPLVSATLGLWPTALVFLRREPTRGSGLQWLWTSEVPNRPTEVVTPVWWFKRGAIFVFSTVLFHMVLGGDDDLIAAALLLGSTVSLLLFRPWQGETFGIVPRDVSARQQKRQTEGFLYTLSVESLWAAENVGIFGYYLFAVCAYTAAWLFTLFFADISSHGRQEDACFYLAVFQFPIYLVFLWYLRPQFAPQGFSSTPDGSAAPGPQLDPLWSESTLSRPVAMATSMGEVTLATAAPSVSGGSRQSKADTLAPVLHSSSHGISGSGQAVVADGASITAHPSGYANPVETTRTAQAQVRPVPSIPSRVYAKEIGWQITPNTVRVISGRRRLADLTISMFYSAILVLVFGGVTGFLSPLFGNWGNAVPDPGKLGLFVLTSLCGVWSLQIVSKLMEGRGHSTQFHRIVTAITGLVVGGIAWLLSQYLMVDLKIDSHHQAIFRTLGRQPLVIENSPTWLSFVVYFGLLFGTRRWWWHADSCRPAAFKIRSVLLTVGIGATLPLIFSFPWDWAMTWAAVMSCVLQLSAVWTPPEQRQKVSE